MVSENRSIYFELAQVWSCIDLSILAILIWVRNYAKELPTAVARYWMRASCSLVNAVSIYY